MKNILRLLLAIVAIPTFFILLILTTLKFQLLDNAFWVNSFKTNNLGGNLEIYLKRVIGETEDKKEIDKNEATVISSLITRTNIELVFEGNIKHTLNYLNGKDSDWKVFIPTDKLPKDLLPTFMQGSDTTSLQTILSFYNRGQEEQAQIPSQINMTGQSVLLSLIIFATILFVILLTLLLLTDPGKRFVWVSTPLIISSITVVSVSLLFSMNHQQIAKELLTPGNEPSQILIGATAPYILKDVANLWTKISSIVLALALLILFFKKPISGKTKRI